MPKEQLKLWLERVCLRKQLYILFLLCEGQSVADISFFKKVSEDSVRFLQRSFVRAVAHVMEEINGKLHIGGERVHCEADEIAFRCQKTVENGVEGVKWLRYIAIVRRRSFKIWLAPLPNRFCKASGQGGGGALSVEELVNVFRVNTDDPVLVRRSLLHTDSAKAYNRLGPLRWPSPRALQDTDLFTKRAPFAQWEYSHTAAPHKKKAGKRVQFASERRVQHWDGREQDVLGGTQYVDGLWPFLRTQVGRKAVNTGLPLSEKREWLHFLVRCAQWRWWFLDHNRFELYGSYLRQAREQ